MNKQEFLDLCPLYALGALDGDDLARFRAVLADARALDDEMRAALAEATHAAAQLSLAAPEAVPSAAVKDRLMARIRSSEASVKATEASSQTAHAAPPSAPQPARRLVSPKSRQPSWLDRVLVAWLTPRPAFAVAFGLLVLSVGLVVYVQTLNRTVNDKDVALTVARSHILELRDSLSRKDALLEVIRARGLQVVAMAGTEASPAGYGKILWDPERKSAVLQVSLPPQPSDKDYQLWVIRDGKPVDAGVFQVSTGGADDGMYRIEQLVETDKAVINAFAVTVEPKGGVPQPTGSMVLLGAVEI